MKYLYFISVLALFSCSKDYEEFIPQFTPEEVEYSSYLDAAIAITYETHLWMSEEGECQELECCWEYVSTELRYKYENNEYLSIKEKEDIIKYIESSPSFLDTIGEGDEFYHLWCYQEYGSKYFEEYTDPDE